MKSRPTSLGQATILLLLVVLLLLQVVSSLGSTIDTTASVLSVNNNKNKPLPEDDKAIERSRLPYTYKHVARQKDYNDEYVEDWFASILYPKLKTGNHEPEIFYRGDTVVVTYLSSFHEAHLDVFCYNDTKQSGGENLTWHKFCFFIFLSWIKHSPLVCLVGMMIVKIWTVSESCLK